MTNTRQSTKDLKRQKFEEEIVEINDDDFLLKKPKCLIDLTTDDEHISSPESLQEVKKKNSVTIPTKAAVMSILAAADGQMKECDAKEKLLKEHQRLKFYTAIKNGQCSRSCNVPYAVESTSSKFNEVLIANGSQKRKTNVNHSNLMSMKQKTTLLMPPIPLTYENPIHQEMVDDTVMKWKVEDDILLMASIHHVSC